MNDQPRGRHFGCLTLFSIFCLTGFTLGEGTAVWFLNPDWFDRLAFWRGPILEPDLVVAQDADSRAKAKADFDKKQPPAPKPAPVKPVLFATAAVSGAYGHNRATFLFVNPSLTQDAPTLEVRRWLLLAPSWLLAARQSARGTPDGRNWKLAWHTAELKDYPEAFKGYNLYRRRPGGDPAWTLVKEDLADERWTDTALDDEDYVYGVRAKDVLGNLGEIKEQDNNDPWAGTWEGDVRLIEGSFVVALRRGLKKAADDSDRKEAERIAAIADEQQRQSARQRHEQERKTRDEIVSKVMELVELAEQAARLGVPIQIKIHHDGGRYTLGITEVPWQDIGWKASDDLELERVDANTLRLKTKLPPEFPPFELHLRRTPANGRNQVRGEWTLDVPDDPNHTRFRIAWDLYRRP